MRFRVLVFFAALGAGTSLGATAVSLKYEDLKPPGWSDWGNSGAVGTSARFNSKVCSALLN